LGPSGERVKETSVEGIAQRRESTSELTYYWRLGDRRWYWQIEHWGRTARQKERGEKDIQNAKKTRAYGARRTDKNSHDPAAKNGFSIALKGKYGR